MKGVHPGGQCSKLQAQPPGDYVPGRNGFLSSFFISVSSAPTAINVWPIRIQCNILSESMNVWRLNFQNLFLNDHLVTQWVTYLPKDWLTGKTPQKPPAHMGTDGSSHPEKCNKNGRTKAQRRGVRSCYRAVCTHTVLEGSINFRESLSPWLSSEMAQNRQRSAYLRFTTNATSNLRIKYLQTDLGWMKLSGNLKESKDKG